MLLPRTSFSQTFHLILIQNCSHITSLGLALCMETMSVDWELGLGRHRKLDILEQATLGPIEILLNECSPGIRFPGYSVICAVGAWPFMNLSTHRGREDGSLFRHCFLHWDGEHFPKQSVRPCQVFSSPAASDNGDWSRAPSRKWRGSS